MSDNSEVTIAHQNIKPLGNYLVVKLITEEVSAGGILYTSNQNKAVLLKAEVLAVGPGLKDKDGLTIPMSVKYMDKVLMNHQGVVSLGRWGGYNDVLMVSETHVQAVLEG